MRKFINLKLLSKRKVPYDEIIRMELVLVMAVIAFIIGLPYIVVGLFLDFPAVIFYSYCIFYLISIPAVLILTRKGYINQAKILMMLFGSCCMLIKASCLGRDSGMNLSMMIILFGIFAFYNIRDYKYIIASLFFVLSGIAFLEYTDYSFISNDQTTSRFEYPLNLLSTIVFCIFCFYLILRLNEYTNKKLERLNNKLRGKNSKLVKINKELDSYLYKASHDMRAPLTSLMGLINLIKVENDPDKLLSFIGLQEQCILKLDTHLYQIINISRNLKTGVLIEKIDFKEIIDHIFEELIFFENAKNTKKLVTIEDTVFFFSDGYRIKTILHNLISNSFKYAKAGNLDAQIEINCKISSDNAKITVKDNGIGIPEANQLRIFEMFYRGTTLSKGSGLGLYIVNEIITKLGGSIEVNSHIGQFTSFTIILPNLKSSMHNLKTAIES